MIILWSLLFWGLAGSSQAYFADWSALAEDRQPTCVAIPSNMSLCTNIGYTKMRLPNLLEHDTIQEASQQAGSWVPLTKVNCAEDAQLFLCSLFAPVCLERPIYPCRSLCQKVKAGCEGTMKRHGYPWPSMLDCDKFPLDNDMCITSQAEASQGRKEAEEEQAKKTAQSGGADTDVGKAANEETTNGRRKKKKNKNESGKVESTCQAKLCNQDATYESILTNYCQADFVVKVKFRLVKKAQLQGRKVNTVYKTWRGTPSELRKLRKPRLQLDGADECCSHWIKSHSRKQRFLVMGKNLDNSLVPTFIVPWSRDKEMKRARRMFKQIDCSNWNKEHPSSLSRKRREDLHQRNVNKRRHQRKRKSIRRPKH